MKHTDNIRKLECPNCGKKGHLNRIIKFKNTFPHGVKSGPRKIPRTVKYFCAYKREAKRNVEEYICKARFTFNLHRGDYDYIGGVK